MNNITFKSQKRFTAFCAVVLAIGFVLGFVFGLMIPNVGADDAIDYSSMYTSEVIADHGIYRFVPDQPYIYGSDYYRDNTKTHKTEHGGKPSYYCKACIDYYLDMGGYVLARDGDIVYYTGVDIRDLQKMQGSNRNFTVMRDPRLFTYGSDIFDPPLVTAQSGGGAIGDSVRITAGMYSAYFAPQQRQELLCSALDNMLLCNEPCFLGIYAYRASNWYTGSNNDNFCLIALYGDSTGSYVLSEEGTIDGHTSYRFKTSAGSHAVHYYSLNSDGWYYVGSSNLSATGVLMGTVQTGFSFGFQYLYPIIANNAPTSAVGLMTGDLTLPAQRATAGYQYPRFISVSSATRTSGSLIAVDSAITSKVSWLAIRHVYNLAKVQTGGGGSSDYEYTEAEYLAYGEQKKQEGINSVTQNPAVYNLKTQSEYSEYGDLRYETGKTYGINLVKANPTDYGIATGEVVENIVRLPITDVMNAILESPATIARAAFGDEGINREVFGIAFYDILLLLGGISIISVAVMVVKKFL